MNVPASNLKVHTWQEVHMTDKENLHLGEAFGRAACKETTGVKMVQAVGAEMIPSDDIGMSMGEFIMMKFLVWNCRGAASRGVASVIRDSRQRYKLDMVVLLEPRISGNNASKVIKRWGFKHSIRKEAEGFSGGIWLLWDVDELTVDVITMHEQFIHCRVSLGEEVMLLTAIYASPTEQRRHILWELLYELACVTADPWVLIGDFNEIKTPLEQKGGGRINETRCRRFNDWIEDCRLIDMGAQGPLFTWKGPKWEGLERVYKRLDRCLCSLSWHERFEEAEIRVLPRICSDHHPLLVRTTMEGNVWRQRNFRYEAMWKMHEQFDNVMATCWRRNLEAHYSLDPLQIDLIKWNKEMDRRQWEIEW
ncbi:hypothetical protein K1719_006867 [Acacia pycnantha]|nr:hypothetical protein K1719_006867 [Acacia pycnantha]